MRHVVVFIVAVLLMATSCKKESTVIIELKKKQTQCSDPWGYGATEQETVNRLKDYLAKKNILVIAISLKNTQDVAVCLACVCASGNTFYLQADEQYINALKLEGFE
jgi:hypothetical protein